MSITETKKGVSATYASEMLATGNYNNYRFKRTKLQGFLRFREEL